MRERSTRRGFASRPGDADSWVRAPEQPPASRPQEDFSARLTIDVTPALRGRIKVTAFRRGMTVADWRGLWKRRPNAEVALEVDVPRFLRAFFDAMERLARG